MDINKVLFWVGHASFYIKGDGFNIFVDPFRIGPSIKEKADFVLITHAHADHCSKEDVLRVLKPEGEVICPRGCFEDGAFKNFTLSAPEFTSKLRSAEVEAVPAYNAVKERLQFHPRENKWVGYIIDIGGFKIYHAGDTDHIEEMDRLKGIGASLLPMGGTFTMDADEAIGAANSINAEYSIPMHYKQLLGKEGSAKAEGKFRSGARGALVMDEAQPPAYSF